MRRAVAEEAVKATAFQNAVIGGVTVIPGADMPLMTANQAKMVLQIAAAYGQPLGAERIKELAAVVGGGFALRAIARQALAFVPGFGWAIKAGIGYTGTMAMGYAAIEYFEAGGDMRRVGRQGEERARPGDRGRPSRVRRGEPPRSRSRPTATWSSPRRPRPSRCRSSRCRPPTQLPAPLRHRTGPALSDRGRPVAAHRAAARAASSARRATSTASGALAHDADADYRAALVYPDTYEIGQANQAIAILYARPERRRRTSPPSARTCRGST